MKTAAGVIRDAASDAIDTVGKNTMVGVLADFVSGEQEAKDHLGRDFGVPTINNECEFDDECGMAGATYDTSSGLIVVADNFASATPVVNIEAPPNIKELRGTVILETMIVTHTGLVKWCEKTHGPCQRYFHFLGGFMELTISEVVEFGKYQKDAAEAIICDAKRYHFGRGRALNDPDSAKVFPPKSFGPMVIGNFNFLVKLVCVNLFLHGGRRVGFKKEVIDAMTNDPFAYAWDSLAEGH
jgi:hypothetical protein